MIDVVGNDGAAAGDFVADEFRGDELGNAGAEALAGVLAFQQFGQAVETLVFADGDKFHFRRDDALTCIVHLRDIAAGLGAARLTHMGQAQFGKCGIGQASTAVGRGLLGQALGVATLFDPGIAQRGKAAAQIDADGRVGVGAGAVVNVDRRILFAAHAGGRIGLGNFAHRHADVRP